MKAVVLYIVRGQPGLADHDVLLGGVEHVGHPGAAQVVQVAHRLAVTDDDARADLNRVRFNYMWMWIVLIYKDACVCVCESVLPVI